MNIAFVLSTLRALDRVENQNFIKHGVAFVNNFFKSQTIVLVNDDENISHHNILQFQNILGFFFQLHVRIISYFEMCMYFKSYICILLIKTYALMIQIIKRNC